MGRSLVDDFYAKLVNEEDARVCREIPDAACREVPRNFFLLIGSYVLTKLVLSVLGLAGAAMSRLLPEVT